MKYASVDAKSQCDFSDSFIIIFFYDYPSRTKATETGNLGCAPQWHKGINPKDLNSEAEAISSLQKASA